MLRKIELYYPPALSDSVHLKMKDVELHRQIRTAQKKAEKKIQRLLQEAETDREEFIRQGYNDGYRDGFRVVVRTVLKLLLDNHRYIQSQRKKIADEVSAILQASLDHPDVILSLITEWSEQLSVESAQVHLLLPERIRSHEAEIRNILRETVQCELVLTYHDQDNYILTCDEGIAEFMPSLITGMICEELMDKYHFPLSATEAINHSVVEFLYEECEKLLKKDGDNVAVM